MNDLPAIRAKWLVQCGICEFGILGPCVCLEGDPRNVIDSLCSEVELLRIQLAATNVAIAELLAAEERS